MDKFFTKTSFSTMNELYKDIEDQRADFRNDNLTDLLAPFFLPGKVLDVGCGAGFLLQKVARRKTSQCFGLEPNKQMEKLLEKLDSSITVLPLWAEQLGELQQHFSTISMIDVLEHIADDNAQIALVLNALQPGGNFIVVVPAFPRLYGRRDRSMGHYRRYTKKNLLNKLRQQGFIIRQVRYWNFLGILPYFIFERVLQRPLHTSLRSTQKKGLHRFIARTLYYWFQIIENRFSFGCGLSLLVIAEKPTNG